MFLAHFVIDPSAVIVSLAIGVALGWMIHRFSRDQEV